MKKLWHIKNNSVPVIMRTLAVIKKGTNKNTLTSYQAVAANMKYTKFHFAEPLIFKESYKCERKLSSKKHKYIDYI